MKNADHHTEKLNRSGPGALRFPTNRSLTMYFMRGSIVFFAGSAVFACLVSMFDLVIPRLIQWTVDAVIGGNLASLPGWAAGALDQLGGADYLRSHLWLAAALVAGAALGGAVIFLSPAASFYAVLRDLTGEKLLMPAAAPGLQYPGEHGSLLASALMAAFSYLAAAGLLLFAAAQRLRSRTV
jgi:ABC-type multidrug transport system fused ATPase/permease subunit